MQDILVLDAKNYDPAWPVSSRRAVRAVIRRGDELLMVYVSALNMYKFPGGGMERGESPEETLQREIREETGFSLDMTSLIPWGRVVELRKNPADDEIYRQESFYYFADLVDHVRYDSLDLDDYEKKLGFTPVFVSPHQAREANCAGIQPGDTSWAARDAAVLDMLIREKGNLP